MDIKQSKPTISQLKNHFIKNNKIDFRIYYSGNKLDDSSLSENIFNVEKNMFKLNNKEQNFFNYYWK